MTVVLVGDVDFPDVDNKRAVAGLEDFQSVVISITDNDEKNVSAAIIEGTPSTDSRIELGVGATRSAVTFYKTGDTITTPTTPPTGVTVGTTSLLFRPTAASGAITADSDNLYVVTRNTLRPFSRSSPYTAGTPIDLPGTDVYAGVAIDGTHFWLWDEASNRCIRINRDGSNPVTYTINTPASLRHTGMALVGKDLYVSDGDTSTVHVYTIPDSGTSLVRSRTITAPFRSFGFFADENFLYYIDYSGNLRIHNAANTEVARASGISVSVVGLTVFDGTLYTSNESGSDRRVTGTPLTFTGGVTGGTRPALPLQLGDMNVGDTQTLHIKRVIEKNAKRFENDGFRVRVIGT